MHSVPFFDTVTFLWWLDWPVLVILIIYIYIYIHSVPFFNTNSTIISLWWLGWPILVILRIYIYIYAFCTVFQHKFHYNIFVVTRLTYFWNFRIHIYIYVSFFSTNSTVIIMSDQNDLFWFHNNTVEMKSKSILFPLWDDIGKKSVSLLVGITIGILHSNSLKYQNTDCLLFFF